MVKVGKVKFAGRDPVVNVKGAETVPSFRTYLMRYVVLGSMPATRKLVLSPGTMGSGAVIFQDWSEPSRLELDVHRTAGGGGRAVEGDQGIGRGTDHGAGSSDPRIRGIGRGGGLAGCGAEAVLDGHLDVIGPLLHGVPDEAIAGAEVTNHVGRTTGRSDAELVDGCRRRGRWPLPSR